MTQTWDPGEYARHARFVSELGQPVIDLLNPKRGERVLDLGCGDGALTEKLIAAGCDVVAIDSSPEQVWAALERGIDARILDATDLGFEGGSQSYYLESTYSWFDHSLYFLILYFIILKRPECKNHHH